MKSSFRYVFYWLLFILLIGKVNAQPKGVHLSWNGNKVNTSGTMSATWMNDKEDNAVIVYSTDSINLDKRISADAKYVPSLSTYINKVTLKKLSPSTYYYYKVGSDENGWSKIYTFRTGAIVGDNDRIVIDIWSDTQNNGGNYNFEQTDTIVKQLSKNACHFTIHNGDIVENGSVAKSWIDFFYVSESVNANNPLMSVTGNHDVVNDTASQIFQKPFPIFYELMNLPHDQLNYSYEYGNTHFVAINSGWAEGAAKVGKVLFEKNSVEYDWLEKDLKKARKNKRIKWIILYSHYPVYSFGFSHIPTWQGHIKPLVDKYKVDLYLAGHRHVYERHKAIRGSEIFESTDAHVYTNPRGTVYVTNGSCGGNLTGIGGQNLSTMIYTPKEKIYTYAIMTIEGNTITYKVFDKQGKQVDYFQIRKE
jgi:acid phosphatase type 7